MTRTELSELKRYMNHQFSDINEASLTKVTDKKNKEQHLSDFTNGINNLDNLYTFCNSPHFAKCFQVAAGAEFRGKLLSESSKKKTITDLDTRRDMLEHALRVIDIMPSFVRYPLKGRYRN